jgi:hypothetical protein
MGLFGNCGRRFGADKVSKSKVLKRLNAKALSPASPTPESFRKSRLDKSFCIRFLEKYLEIRF